MVVRNLCGRYYFRDTIKEDWIRYMMKIIYFLLGFVLLLMVYYVKGTFLGFDTDMDFVCGLYMVVLVVVV